jgi:hypothetical protein
MTIENINEDLEERLNEVKDDVINHMNKDHAEANLTYVRALAGMPDATSARIIDFDQFRVSLSAETPNGSSNVQVEFLEPLEKSEDIRPALIKLLKYARACD